MSYTAEFECWLSGKDLQIDKIINFPHINVLNMRRKGEIGTKGRFKNIAYPYSTIGFNFGEANESEFIRNLWKNREIFDLTNEEERHFTVGIFYTDQCNFAFSVEEMRILSELNLDLEVSCYDISDELK